MVEAVAVQNAANGAAVGPRGPAAGSGETPDEAFRAVVQKLLAAEEEPGPEISEDVTPDLRGSDDADETDEAAEKGEELVTTFVDSAGESADGEPPPEVSEKETDSDEVDSAKNGSGVAPGQVSGLPSPADEEFAEALAEIVAGALADHPSQATKATEHLPRPAEDGFGEALRRVVEEGSSPGEPAAVSANGSQAGSTVVASEDAQALPSPEVAVEDGQAEGAGKPLSAVQALAAEADQASAASSVPTTSEATEPQDEAAPASPLPSTPKEAVEVETLRLARAQEPQEAEVKPVQALEDDVAPSLDHRAAHTLEGAKAADASQGAPHIREGSSVSRPMGHPMIERLVQQVVETVQSGPIHDRNEVTLRLEPPSLGKLHLWVSMEDSKLQVTLYTTTTEAKDLVESNALQLKAALQQQGLELEQFSVEVRSGLAQNMAQQDWSGWLESFSGRPGAGRLEIGPNEPGVAALASARRESLSRIDLFV